ncbi:MAG: pyridoxal phosphate-dependent aminotransferase [Acidobacteriaceae bacterium]|nr:pyridoxal phosphate-dependent aminotransferase [Acidobacteriaceae bacterium]
MSRLLEEKRRNGARILDLTNSNPTKVVEYPDCEIRAALSGIGSLAYRPDSLGLEEARLAVSNLYREQGFEIAPSRVALTASTSEAYGLLFKLLCDPGDDILVPAPSYPLFEYLAGLENVRPVPYRLQYDGSWFIDFTNLREQISPRTRALIVVTPNNPTGSFLKSWELQRLAELAREMRVSIISDEVFMSYEFGTDPQRVKTMVGEDSVLSFSLNGLSKAAAMPQMKLAWIVINGPLVEREVGRERLGLLLDTYLSVNTPVQLALPALFEIGARIRSELCALSRENLTNAQKFFEGSPIEILHTEGGWSALLRLPSIQREEDWINRLLSEKNVLMQPGFFFDMPSEAYAVASLIIDRSEFQEGISRLRQLVECFTRC